MQHGQGDLESREFHKVSHTAREASDYVYDMIQLALIYLKELKLLVRATCT